MLARKTSLVLRPCNKMSSKLWLSWKMKELAHSTTRSSHLYCAKLSSTGSNGKYMKSSIPQRRVKMEASTVSMGLPDPKVEYSTHQNPAFSYLVEEHIILINRIPPITVHTTSSQIMSKMTRNTKTWNLSTRLPNSNRSTTFWTASSDSR